MIWALSTEIVDSLDTSGSGKRLTNFGSLKDEPLSGVIYQNKAWSEVHFICDQLLLRACILGALPATTLRPLKIGNGTNLSLL